METLRRRSDDETQRRAEAEAEVARLARDAERESAEDAAQPAPFEFPAYRPPAADPAPDPGAGARPPPRRSAPRRPAGALRPGRRSRRRAPGRAGDAGDPDAATRAARGTLEDLPAPRLLALAARAEVTGRIDFDGEASRSLYFEGGRIVGATSADPSDRVEDLALRLGLVTRDQYRLVGAAAPLATRRAAVVLLERGFLKPTELHPGSCGAARRRSSSACSATPTRASAGRRRRCRPTSGPRSSARRSRSRSRPSAAAGARRRWTGCSAATRRSSLRLRPGLPPRPSPSRARTIRAVALADGLRTLDEIVAASPLDPLSTRQALAALVLVGALAVRPSRAGRPAAAATAAIDLARVRDKLDQVRRADYFTILGVGRLCTPHEVRQAAERLRPSSIPRRFHGDEGGRARRAGSTRSSRVVADAREVLADDRLREEYLRGLGD